MQTRVESLKITIRLIKYCGKVFEMDITEAEMAQKVNVTEKRFQQYLDGKKRMPNNFTYLLVTAYDDIIKAQQMQTTSSVIRNTIALIKQKGLEKGLTITEEEMAETINVPIEKFNIYIKGVEHTPDEIIELLHLAYKDLLIGIMRVTHTQHIQVRVGDKRFHRRL